MGRCLFNKSFSYARCVLFIVLVNLFNFGAVFASYATDYTILALGDSLSAGYGLKKGEGFPEQLETALRKQGENIRVINGGVSGDTTTGGVARLNWALADVPDLVILELGANDGLRGLNPDLTENNLNQMIRELHTRGIKVLLAGMRAPPNLGEEYGMAFNSVYLRLAKRHNVALYPFFLEGVAGVTDLNLEDGLHPTPKGISLIVKKIMPYVLKLKEKG